MSILESSVSPSRPVRIAPPPPAGPDLRARAEQTLAAAVDALMGKLREPDQRWGNRSGESGDGLHWCAELEGDSILSSEYLLMKLILGQENDEESEKRVARSEKPDGADRRVGRPTLMRIVDHLRMVQRADGTWGQYPGSPPDLSACVKAYLALKCFGDSPQAPHMLRAKQAILALGGAEKCNTFSTFYLACLGQVSWDACPAIPPEIVLLPRWFPFHMDFVAAWTRTMILPLAICSALRPVRRIPDEWGIDELFIDKRAKSRLNQDWNTDEPACWKNFFLVCDRALKLAQKLNLLPLRARALKLAEQWILQRVSPETTEGLGAIFPPMVYLQVAFNALGYDRGHPVMVKAERDLDDFMVDGDTGRWLWESACSAPQAEGLKGSSRGLSDESARSDTPGSRPVSRHDPEGVAETNTPGRRSHIRLQPCFSPIWDTGIALYAATEAGLTAANDPRIARVCDWLIARQVRRNGDWVRNLRPEDQSIELGPHGDAAAWAFEYRNEWYPDVDDTAMVAKALWRAGGKYRHTAQRAVRWILAMQNDDGGWAAFDKTRHREWMESIPFADHNAMQDPSCADITGRTVESLITCGVSRDHPAVTRAVEYILSHQEPEGCWWGRWGVNYIYGTWQALGGLRYAGLAPDHPAIARAVDWVRSVQSEDGGFGESANSYLDRSLMGPPASGPSTPSQTAWGLTCLMYGEQSPENLAAAERAVAWLCDHQLSEDRPPVPTSEIRHPTSDIPSHDRAGAWTESVFTGTGFPRVFYLRYNLYRHYFPVMALARWTRQPRSATAPKASIR